MRHQCPADTPEHRHGDLESVRETSHLFVPFDSRTDRGPEWLRKPVHLRGSGIRVASLTRLGCGLAVAAHVSTAHSADEEDQASQSPEADAEVVAAA
jgi:hypothetical protein